MATMYHLEKMTAWLKEQTAKGEVVNTPPVDCNLAVGDLVTLKGAKKKETFEVIGFAKDVCENGSFVYLNWDCYWFSKSPKDLKKVTK